jgi:hypothetical protein
MLGYVMLGSARPHYLGFWSREKCFQDKSRCTIAIKTRPRFEPLTFGSAGPCRADILLQQTLFDFDSNKSVLNFNLNLTVQTSFSNEAEKEQRYRYRGAGPFCRCDILSM